VRPQLDRLKALSLVRGVRMQLHWHEKPVYTFWPNPIVCVDPMVRRNVARLADYGWTFDLQVFTPQMPDAAHLARGLSKVTFISQACRACRRRLGRPASRLAAGMACRCGWS